MTILNLGVGSVVERERESTLLIVASALRSFVSLACTVNQPLFIYNPLTGEGTANKAHFKRSIYRNIVYSDAKTAHVKKYNTWRLYINKQGLYVN